MPEDKTAEYTAIIRQFVPKAKKAGLPTEILERTVDTYTFDRSDSGNSTAQDEALIELTDSIFISLGTFDADIYYQITPPHVESLYHEVAHAWTIMRMKDTASFRKIFDDAVEYYRNYGKLEDGQKVSDPELMAKEAIAERTSHAVGQYIGLYAALLKAKEDLKTAATKQNRYNHIGNVMHEYAKQRGLEAAGYQFKGFPGFRKEVHTVTAMPVALRTYCDEVMLEGRIPMVPLQSRKLKDLYLDVEEVYRGYRYPDRYMGPPKIPRFGL